MDTTTFTDAFAQLSALGGAKLAERFVQAQEEASPTNFHLGMALLNAKRGELVQLVEHANKARELSPDDPRVLGTVAAAYAAINQNEAALNVVQEAILNDQSPRSWEVLGSLHMGWDNIVEAENAFRTALERDEDSFLGARGVALARWRRADQATALRYFAKAFALNPQSPDLLNMVAQMYAQSGWPISASSMITFIRSLEGDGLDSDAALFLDLTELRLIEEVLEAFPWSEVVDNRETLINGLLDRLADLAPERRIAAAYILTDELSYWDAARACLNGVEIGELSDDVRSRAHYVHGVIAAEDGERDPALEHYRAAIKLNPERWDAGCNAVQLLLEKPSAEAYTNIAHILESIPERTRLAHPRLMLNEAVYLAHLGHITSARSMLQNITERPGVEEPVAARAQQLLEEIETS